MAQGGDYVLKEYGIEQSHDLSPQEPCTPNEYLGKFRKDFTMNIIDQPDENTLIFEMIHLDVSLANALRRILLAEVPTMAIEKIYLSQNTGILHDEVLAHRIGLIPLDVDARLFDALQEGIPLEEQLTDRNVVVFGLDVKCKAPPKTAEKNNNTTEKDDAIPTSIGDTDKTKKKQQHSMTLPAPPLYTQTVYASDLQWMPQGDQQEFLKDRPPKVLYGDIVLAKLRPGQSIALEAHAIRGSNHAKYSPVATASYRLASRITLLKDIYDELAEELVHLYEPGVFGLETTPEGRLKAVVVNPYACTMSRNYMRNKELKEAIEIRRIPDHFIFSVESLGAYPPGVLVAEAIQVLQNKCLNLQGLVDDEAN